MSVRVLGISGSLRRHSHNSRLLRAAAEALPPAAELSRFSGLKAIPPFDEDDEVLPPPHAVLRLRKEIERADAVLIVTPEYNRSVPGQLKNAIDWISRPVATNPMHGKPVTVIGASTGMFGAVWAQEELRKVLAALHARVLEDELIVAHAHEAFDARGRLADPDLDAQLRRAMDRLLAACAPALAA